MGLRREGRVVVEQLVSILYNHISSVTVHAAAARAADLSDIDEALRSGEPAISFEHERRVAFADVHRTMTESGRIQIAA